MGGVPVTGLDPDRLRERVILVTQEHHVFLGTIRDNLRIAAPGAGDAKLRAALAAVGADWIDDLADGRVTELGTHDELVAAGGAYAALWHTWHGDHPVKG